MVLTKLEEWSETAASNIDIGGQPLSQSTQIDALDDIEREHMAQVAKWLGADTLASASTTDLGSVPGRYVVITGTTTITGLGTIKDGTIKYVRFAGALTLTHNATSLILPNGVNATTAAGDTAIMVSEGSGNWRCLGYQRASGFALNGSAGNITMASTGANIAFSRNAGNEITALGGSSSQLDLKAYSVLTIGLGASGTEVARFLNSESAFIFGGTTSVGMDDGSATNVGVAIGDGAISAQRNDGPSLSLSRRSTTGSVAAFSVTGAQVGSISVDGSSTTYNTTSDYRRKPLWEQLSGFWERLEATNPVRFQWDTGDWAHGFIAHEFAVSYPGSVEGEKDAVDAEGKPVYQAMQASTSEVMADVVAALKDLNSRLKEGGL